MEWVLQVSERAQRPPFGNGTPHCFSMSTGSFVFGAVFEDEAEADSFSFFGFRSFRGDRSSFMSSNVGGFSPRATAAAVAASKASLRFFVMEVFRTFLAVAAVEVAEAVAAVVSTAVVESFVLAGVLLDESDDSFRFLLLPTGVDGLDVRLSDIKSLWERTLCGGTFAHEDSM